MEIKDIKEIQFDLQFRGYNMRQVDGILENVTKLAQELTEKASALKQQNMGLKQQVNDLEAEKITAYNEYLEYAKIISRQKISEAEQQAASIVRSAEYKARTIVGNSNEAVTEAQTKLDKIRRDTQERIETARVEIMQIMNFTDKAQKQINGAFENMGTKSSACLELIESTSNIHADSENRIVLSAFDESTG